MKERRQFVRLSAKLPITYRVLPSSAIEQSLTKDVGGGGIRVYVQEPFSPGTALEVAIKLPERERVITFTGVVVWCQTYDALEQAQRKRTIETGIKFVYMKQEDQQAIMQHVASNLQARS